MFAISKNIVYNGSHIYDFPSVTDINLHEDIQMSEKKRRNIPHNC